MNHLRRLTFALLAVAMTCAVAAPVRSAEPAPATINLINLPADSSAVVYYALDLGYFKEENLDVKITPMTNSGAIIAAIAGGGGDIGNSVVGSLSDARAKGIPVLYFAPAGLYDAVSQTAGLMVRADSPIKTAKDLAGKTVAVSGLNDLTYYATRAWIDKNGGKSSDVKYLELPFPAMAAAVDTKRVDAAYIIEPFMTASGAELHSIGKAGEAVAPRYLATGWIANESWLASHADVALRFGVAIRKAAVWANAHQKDSALILQKYTKIDPTVLEHMHRAIYALNLEPRLLQPPIDTAAKYSGNPVVSANTLIWAPAK